jgi:hypothetical protein
MALEAAELIDEKQRGAYLNQYRNIDNWDRPTELGIRA